MPSILVGTDFSEGSMRALERAAALAKALGWQLSVVHVFNETAWGRWRASVGRQSAVEDVPAHVLSARLLELTSSLRERHGIIADYQVLTGRASEQMVSAARIMQVDLMVVGAHGENWLRELFVGGSALKILEQAPCPVLAVRGKCGGPYENILVGIDASDAAKRAASAALRLFGQDNLAMLCAYSIPFEGIIKLSDSPLSTIDLYREGARLHAQTLLRDLCRELSVESMLPDRVHAVYGYPSMVLCQEAQSSSADLVVLGRHGGTVIDEARLGSTTRNVLHQAKCDVLVVP